MAEVGTIHEQELRSAQAVTIGSIGEALGGVGAAAVAIIALAGVKPEILLGVAIIAAGAALILEGGAIASRFTTLLHETSDSKVETTEISGGVTGEFIGGVTGVVLGILMLLNIYPLILASISVIVFGGTLLIGSGTTSRMNSLVMEHNQSSQFTRKVTREAVEAAAGVQILIGIGAVVLGILGLTGIDPLILSLVGVLSIGAADLISGSAVSGRLMGVFSPHSAITGRT